MDFFYGTYGFDWLSTFLIILSILLNQSRHTRLIGVIVLIIAIYRALSKDIPKRRAEMNKFILLVNKVIAPFGKQLPKQLPVVSLQSFGLLFQHLANKFKQSRQYKIVKCPQCSQKLRLPRGKGKIIVTCKKCSHEFRLRT